MGLLTFLRLLTQLLDFQGAADGVWALLQAASITQTSAPEPSLLDQQIKDVEGKISMLETGEEKLLSTKPDGWQQERAYLREEKKQLREKEKQLREKELLLLRKPET